MARVLQPCGTRAAYNRHLAHHQLPCEECYKANRHRLAAQRRPATVRRQAAAEQDALFRQLLDLIAGECRRAGMLP